MGVRHSTFLHASSDASFGPDNCVMVEKSSTGTCVLRTQCAADVDLESTEFAFLCVLANGEVQKHSYGQGGFDAEESYDSSVACNQCMAPNQTPPQVALHATSATAESVTSATSAMAKNETKAANATAPKGLPVDLHTDGAPWKNETEREKYLQGLVAKPPHKKSFYGPDNCVQTYLGDKGTCVMETKCKADAIKDHELGLTCVEKNGKSTRHLFGKNAFNPEETFDTLIDCEICLGLDVAKLAKPMSIKDTIASLKTEVAELKKGMESVSGDVKKLNEKVFPEAKEGDAAASFVHHATETQTVTQKKTHHVQEDTNEQEQATEVEDTEVADNTEDADEDEAPRPKKHHKAHKKHHKKHHHSHKHHGHKKHRVHHQEDDDEEQPVEQVESVQEVKEDQPAEDQDVQPAVSNTDSDSSDSESDGW